MGSSADWLLDTIDLFTAAIGRGRRRRRLVVERLPDGGWDWVTWSRDPGAPVFNGKSPAPWTAMREAERAACLALAGHYGCGPPHGGYDSERVLAFDREVHYLSLA